MSTKAKFCYGLIVIVAVLALWAVLHWWFELSVAEVIAAMVGVALATFAALTWLTYEKLAEVRGGPERGEYLQLLARALRRKGDFYSLDGDSGGASEGIGSTK